MNLSVKFRDLNKEERVLVKNHLKSIRDFLLETSKGIGRPLSFDYDFGDPRTMNDGRLHEKTRSISVRGRKRQDGTIEYSVLGSSGCLNQALSEEDYNETTGSPAAGWQDDYALQLLKYWKEIKEAFLKYINGIQNASQELKEFQL
jgi:hypothetical protein